MQINMECREVQISSKLKAGIMHKLKKLESAYERMDTCDIYFRSEKNNKQPGCVVEIKVLIPKHVLFAAASSENFEAAAHQALDELKLQILKIKGKAERFR